MKQFFKKLCSRYGEMMREKRENFFSREKKFSRSPRAPLTLSRKAGYFFTYFYLPLSGTEPFKKISAGKAVKALLLILVFLFIAAADFFQIYQLKYGYADSGAFWQYAGHNGITYIKRPEYFNFSDPVNFKLIENAPKTPVRNTLDIAVKATRKLAKYNNKVYDIRWLGSLWITALLAGVAILLYGLYKVKNPWSSAAGAVALTFFATYPSLMAYMPTFYLPGAFVSLFTLCAALCTLGLRRNSKTGAVILFILQAGALSALVFLNVFAFGLFFCFAPFMLAALCRDLFPAGEKKYIAYAAALTVIFAAAFPLYHVFGTDGIGAPKKFNFYMRHLLPNMDKPHKFLGSHGFSAGAINEVGNNLMCDYYSNNKLYQKHFLQTLPNMPGAGMLFRDPRIAVKSFAELNRPHLNDGLGASLIYSRPGMSARSKPGQDALRFTPVSHSFMSNNFVIFIMVSGVLLLLWHIIEFARKNGDAAAALLHFALLMSPLVVFAPGLANHGIEEHLIMDIMYPLLITLAVNCFIQFFHLLGKRLKSEIYQAVTRESLFFYFVFVMMMAMEYIFRGTLLDIMPVTENLLFQAFVIYCMILPLRIFAGIPCAFVVLSYFTIMWGLSNYVKEAVWGIPLMPDEFISFTHVWKSIMLMSGTASFKFTAVFTFACLIAAVLCAVFDKKHKFTLFKTVAAVIIASAVVIALGRCNVPKAFIPLRFSEIISKVEYLFRVDGMVLRFIDQARKTAITPDDSARELLKNEADKIAAEQKKYRFDEKAVKPHVVIILNEAGVNPVKFKNLNFPDGSPFDVEKIAKKIKYSSKHDVITGVLQVPVFGGGTVKPEFEVLTGINSYMMPYIPYARVAKNKCGSIANELGKRGYTSSFLHPFPKTIYSRHEALPNMGINNLLDIEHFPPARSKGDFPFYPDMDFYKNVVKQLKSKGDKPQFFYCVSIQNHGPYDTPRFRHVPPYKFSTLRDVTDAHRVLLQRYLNGISLTDKAIRQFFIDLEREVKHPTVVVIFGDHYPSLHVDDYDIQGLLDPDFLANNKKSNHKTEYLVWSNFKLPNARVFTPEMKTWELGRRLVCAAGVVPYNEWIYLFDRLNKSDILMKSRCDIQPKLFNGMKLEEGIDNYFRMYHALSYGEFTGVK